MINDIKNNTISEADTKRKINKLSQIKNVETKGKRLIDTQKTLLSLFDDLNTIFNNNNNNNKIENEDNNKIVNEDNNVNDSDDYDIDDDYDSDDDHD